MTPEQALEVLELKPGATADEIRAAYNRLMHKVHSDAWGTLFAKQLKLARRAAHAPAKGAVKLDPEDTPWKASSNSFGIC